MWMRINQIMIKIDIQCTSFDTQIKRPKSMLRSTFEMQVCLSNGFLEWTS